ncbi:MAG: RdgB/HAM1 family non-canonical purine NTP pyrophosphatase [Muribaculaceae bacterium]|nr:RdgB/HAM1 family non-canonical purine NTP pyrophosphatase [Muribaculaceae bacterium]
MNHLVFASNNPHKRSDISRNVGARFEILSLADIGCHDDIPETADTLEGNALIKARWVKERYGYDCFADDTGLMVDALDGAPGVMTARFAGEHCTPADNVALLLRKLQGNPLRTARFSTVIALIKDGREQVMTGTVEGEIATEERGTDGFGYDPIFIPEGTGKTFAEMGPDAKNEISHRGRATAKLLQVLNAEK